MAGRPRKVRSVTTPRRNSGFSTPFFFSAARGCRPATRLAVAVRLPMAPAFPGGTADMQPERDHLRRFFRHSKNACRREKIALVPGARIQTMCVYVWQAKLLCNDRDVSTGHQILRSLGGGFHLPSYYAPCVRIIRFSFLIFICMMWTIVNPKTRARAFSGLHSVGSGRKNCLQLLVTGALRFSTPVLKILLR